MIPVLVCWSITARCVTSNRLLQIQSSAMAILTHEEIELNAAGKLSSSQIKQVRKKAYIQLVSGLVFVVLVPLSILMADIRLGILLYIWLGLGLLFASIFLMSSLTYFKIAKSLTMQIDSYQGLIKVKPSGKRNVIVTISERAFFLMKNEAASLQDGAFCTINVIEKMNMVIGWTIHPPDQESSDEEIVKQA